MKKQIVVLTETQLDELRMDFDYLADHGQTKAVSFYSWLRHRGYHCDSADNKWFYVVRK